MQFIKPDVRTVCMGQAASAAAILLAAGAPGKRLAVPNARVLIHQPAYSEAITGQASDLEIHAQEIQRMRTLMEEMIAKHSGRPIEQVHADVERDKILTTQEAIDYGIVDAFTTSRKASLAR
jgi:ATP-dependent Clp protease protease subunit